MKIRNPWEGTTIAEFIEGISEQVSSIHRRPTLRLDTDSFSSYS